MLLSHFTSLADHTRFVKDMFYRMSDLPAETIKTRIDDLKDKFRFPSQYLDGYEHAPEQEKLLKEYTEPGK